ncbi:uncharacterized protein EKO05_0005420 [Ascochyta rabiei]|uniref:Uncharacterized protein n=1 Tax=Didymella rabiei TaxID=5454 RepID=A0A163JT04_DIDRA|nr:uncharacterized protein EKO05_0005420 [Ascochyta rabiei]KZM26572.1 hypothetical protein ST47_g2279 [Ascochyta rabiei]UPX14950.1 hypothetical protein EKO05_0005420 [Ascochyta rabiei]
MIPSQSPRRNEEVEYVVVKREGAIEDGQQKDINATPTPTIDQILPQSYTREQATAVDYGGYGNEDNDIRTTFTTATPSSNFPPPLLITMTLPQTQATMGALANNDPTETVVVSLQPPPESHHDGSGNGRISQTTEHLLIAAGSIGATIIIVMIVLAIYTMRRRGMSFSDVIRQGKNQVTRRGGQQTGSKYDWDNKQTLGERYSLRNDAIYPPPPAAVSSRPGSLSSQTRVQPLARSDSFRNGSSDLTQQTFLLEDPPSRTNSRKRNNSTTPSSPVLGMQGQRDSDSTHNTRSMEDDGEYIQQQQGGSRLPAPPTFKQFMSNRPSISQRPGLGGMASRFSWTNSQAPQTPHDPSRDTMNQPLGRESFMTNRSSVPRFRTINSWVNQQSNRIEEQKLKEQYRMTQSSAYSEDTHGDAVPEMPPVPKTYKQTGGLAGKDIKHQRHATNTSVATAPVFQQHPGTEVRFSTRSTVPSEILDMGRKNSVLR